MHGGNDIFSKFISTMWEVINKDYNIEETDMDSPDYDLVKDAGILLLQVINSNCTMY